MARKALLTTTDNPYNPHTHWDEWYAFDTSKGYHTGGYIARIAKSSDELSETDQDLAYEEAIDEILKLNVNGLYKKIYEDDEQ